ncbi:MAG: phosphatase PAP2 family protein [Deltaproteobacteria bacterium]|nr:phosphatase PAP2 family protein [Deltaproteobacteria bacterium]
MTQTCTNLSVPYAEEWLLAFVNTVRVDWLSPIVHGITFIGDAEFYVLFFAIGFATGKRFNFYHLGFLLLTSALINQWAKDLVLACRPLSVTPLITIETGDLSFPSGHAQISAAFWGYLALVSKKTRWRLAAISTLLLIALSRPYLGVHYFHDIAAGLVLGGLLAFVFYYWNRAIDRWLTSWIHAIIVFGGSLFVCLLIPTQSFSAYQYWGALLGLGLGYIYNDRLLKLPQDSPPRRKWPMLIYSLAGVLCFYFGLEKLFNLWGVHPAVSYSLRFFLLTVWVTVGVRWIRSFHSRIAN